MRFFPASTIGAYRSEQELWQALKAALEHEPGKAYFGFRPRHDNGRVIKESDVLIMHQKYGICIIECKGCRINDIREIENTEWHMIDGWHSKIIQPVAQARAARYAVEDEINFHAATLGLHKFQLNNLHYSSFVALPYITKQQWRERKFSSLPTLRGAIFFQEDLNTQSICNRLAEHQGWKTNSVDERVWSSIWDFCKRENLRAVVAEKTKESSGIVRLMNNIASKTITLDRLQQKIASEIPPGPQRLRGLAGTGKTILLVKRAAVMHYEYPDWDIVFTFYTKSLYQQIRKLLDNAYRELLEGHGLTPRSPNWKKLKIRHAWGGGIEPGFYSDLAHQCGLKHKAVKDVELELERNSEKRNKYYKNNFAYVCDCLEADVTNISQLYDAVIIDEGQDLPPSFYRLAYRSLREPKRLYWAFDEAQGLNCLIIPDSESTFGRNSQTNELLVDLRGQYEGGAQKSYVMNTCYRTPRLLLMVAHAINMGLFRQGGVLQGVTTKANWNRLGYEVLGNSDFSDRSVKEGKTVKITRLDEKSPHEVDRTDVNYRNIANSLLKIQQFAYEKLEIEWIAEQVTKDINVREWNESDITIVSLSGKKSADYHKKLKQALQDRGISGYIANNSVFRSPGSVTISTVFRAKGNESWKVYVCRFQQACFDIRSRDDLILKRNQAFTAITRSKAWCVVTGLYSSIFDELKQAKSHCPTFAFPAFNQKSLARVTDDKDSIY